MDRKLVAGALLLLIIQVTYLFADLNGGLGFLRLSSPKATTREIGQLVRTENQVRRKNQSSLVWDESRERDTVFEYDSVLTLAGSSAQVKLDGDGRLHLDENTLIVLEPNQEQESGSIRIRFARGNLRSKNPKSRLNLEKDAWSIDVAQGSDLSLVSLEDGRLALEIFSGRADLKGKDGETQTVQKGEKLRLSDTSIEEKSRVSDDIAWEPETPKRIYSHSFPVESSLKWRGRASILKVIGPKKSLRTIATGVDENETKLDLGPGTHLLELKNETGESSQTVSIQVREAPLFSYFAPFPRDRVRSGENSHFSWQAVPSAHRYRLEVSDRPDFSRISYKVDSEQPEAKLPLQSEGAFYWRVTGVDELGFEIPAPRVYPIYSVPKPLEAPKLFEAPEIRTPAGEGGGASDGSSSTGASLLKKVFSILITSARAQSNPSSSRLEATFNWTEVPGADHYIIEISQQPGFENPLVMEKVAKPSFTWSGFRAGRYFWRVAAGRDAAHGLPEQRGYFSAPSLARLEQGANISPGSGVALRTLPSSPSAQKTVAKPTPSPTPSPVVQKPMEPPSMAEQAPLKESPPSSPSPPSEASKFGGGFSWTPSYRVNQTDNNASIEGSFTGPVLLSFGAFLKMPSETAHWELSGSYEKIDWKPKKPDELPFQPELSETRWEARFDGRKFGRRWAYGLRTESRSFFERSAAETGRFKNTQLYGLSIRRLFRRDGRSGDIAFEPTFGDSIYGIKISSQWLFVLRSSPALDLSIGPRARASYYKSSDSLTTLEGDVGFILGIGW